MYTVVLIRLTLTPESSATRSLPPMANTRLPNGVRVDTNAATSVNTTMIQIDQLTPRRSPAPSSSNPVFPNSARPTRFVPAINFMS